VPKESGINYEHVPFGTSLGLFRNEFEIFFNIVTIEGKTHAVTHYDKENKDFFIEEERILLILFSITLALD
jgi:hypothetical protein